MALNEPCVRNKPQTTPHPTPQDTAHQDVDIRGSEEPSLQLPQTHLHYSPSSGQTWDQRKITSARTHHMFSATNRKFEIFDFYLWRSVWPFNVWISFRACSLPTPGMPLWKHKHAQLTQVHWCWWSDASNGLSHLRDIIAAKEDGNTNKVASAQM